MTKTNLSDAAAALNGGDDGAVPPLPTRSAASKGKKATLDPTTRVRIVLEDNDQIPPGGQFVSANGVAYLLQPGHEIDVPLSVVDVLDHAIVSVPIVDTGNTVIGYRDRLRMPYRYVRPPQPQ